jgi:dTDP-4-dehydrorhamnose reductase
MDGEAVRSMKILLFGKNGQVGWELQRSLAPLGDLVALDRSGEGAFCGDLADLPGIAATIRSMAPDVIVNAAAYTAVDKAESEPGLAGHINIDAVSLMAGEAANLGALLVHYSTDYVFNGRGEVPWKEMDLTGPLSIYGQTKRAGEEAILTSGCQHLIFRTSWVYAARGHNFIKTMLRLGRERQRLSLVFDQIGAPTGAELIADITAYSIRSARADVDLTGVYHLAASGSTSWHGFTEYIFATARAAGVNLTVNDMVPISTLESPTRATRPMNSRLDTRKIRETFGLTMPDWRHGVARVLEELLEQVK